MSSVKRHEAFPSRDLAGVDLEDGCRAHAASGAHASIVNPLRPPHRKRVHTLLLWTGHLPRQRAHARAGEDGHGQASTGAKASWSRLSPPRGLCPLAGGDVSERLHERDSGGQGKEKGRKHCFRPFIIAVGKFGFQTTPRLCSPTTMRPGLNARLKTSSALRGSASPHMNTSNAA